jgi:hypothetical protein
MIHIRHETSRSRAPSTATSTVLRRVWCIPKDLVVHTTNCCASTAANTRRDHASMKASSSFASTGYTSASASCQVETARSTLNPRLVSSSTGANQAIRWQKPIKVDQVSGTQYQVSTIRLRHHIPARPIPPKSSPASARRPRIAAGGTRSPPERTTRTTPWAGN